MTADTIRKRLAALLLGAFLPAATFAATMVPPSAQPEAKGVFAAVHSTVPARTREARLASPLSFEPNLGQIEAPVRFLAHGVGYGLLLTDEEAIMRFLSPHSGAQSVTAPAELRLRLHGALAARPQARLPQEARSNYLSLDGSAPAVTDVPHYAELLVPTTRRPAAPCPGPVAIPRCTSSPCR